MVEAVVPHPPQCPWGERRGRRRRSRRAGRSPRSRSEHGTPPSAPRALDARGIPFQVRGGERFFQRVEVRAALRALRAAAASGPGTDLVADVHAVLGPQGLSAEPPGGNAARARWESLRALVELAEDLVATVPDADLPRSSPSSRPAPRRPTHRSCRASRCLVAIPGIGAAKLDRYGADVLALVRCAQIPG